MTAQRDLMFVMNFRIDSDRALAQLNRQFKNLSAASASATQAVSHVKAIGAAAQQTSNQVQQANAKMSASFMSMGGAIKTALAFFGVYGAGQVFGNLLDAQKDFDRALTKLSFSVKDELPTDLMKEFRQEGFRLGQDFLTLADQFGSFAAAAQSTGRSTKELKDIFISIAEAGTVLKLGKDELKGTFYAIQQMMSKGKVNSEEFRLQLAERLPIATTAAVKALQVLGKDNSITAATFVDMLENGKIVSSVFLPEFAKQLRILSKDALPAAQQSFVATMAEFSNVLTDITLDFNAGFIPAIRNLSIMFRDTFQSESVRKFVGELGELIGTAVMLFGQLGLSVIEGVADGMTAIERFGNFLLGPTGVGQIEAFTKEHKRNFSGMEKIFIAFVAGAISGGAKFILSLDDMVKGVKSLYNVFVDMSNGLSQSWIMRKLFPDAAESTKNNPLTKMNAEVGFLNDNLKNTVKQYEDIDVVQSKLIRKVGNMKLPMDRFTGKPLKGVEEQRVELEKAIAEQRKILAEGLKNRETMDAAIAARMGKDIAASALKMGADYDPEKAKAEAKAQKDALREAKQEAEKLAEAYAKLTTTKASYNEMTQVERVNAAQSTYESLRSKLDDFGTEAEKAARAQALLNQDIANMKAAAEASGDPQKVIRVEEITQRYEQMKAAQKDWVAVTKSKLSDLRITQEEFADSIGSSIAGAFDKAADALAEFVVTGKANFSDLARSILVDLAKIAAKKAIMDIASSVIGFAVGAATGNPAAGAAASASVNAAVKHNGGIVGNGGPSRSVSSSMFAGAARYHSGGMAGLKPNEVPAILQRGEMVIPRNQVGSMGGSNISNAFNVTVQVSGGTGGAQDGSGAEKIGKEVATQLEMMVTGVIQKQMRPGGMLSQKAY